jgi:hypothetical protein
MQNLYLAFSPCLPQRAAIESAGWRLGPVPAFDGQWADEKFRGRALGFLATFVDAKGNQLEAPALPGRVGQPLDGQLPAAEERKALQAALDFGFLDENPRYDKDSTRQGWVVTTSDNTELFLWPIEEGGCVAVATGTVAPTADRRPPYR